MKTVIKNIDDYIALQPLKDRALLEKLRETIKAVAPEAEEVISYGMPAFKYHGMLVGFACYKKHCGFYPWNGSTVKLFKEELKQYVTSVAAIQLPLDKRLPVSLIKKIVKIRMKENIEKQQLKKTTKK